MFNADDFSLYLVSDGREPAVGPHRLPLLAQKAFRGGVRALQVREKHLGVERLAGLCRETKAAARRFGARVLVNGQPDVALACGLDGVHLPGSGPTPEEARRVLGPGRIIGASVHSLEEALEKAPHCDFITLGPVFFTPSKAPYGEPLGPGCPGSRD